MSSSTNTQPLFVILAGGEGSRFAPLVTNKTIFPFMGKPLLQHQLEQLQRVGIERVLIATNQDNDEWLSSFTLPGLEIMTKRQPSPLGMADALLHLAKAIGEQSIVVMNAVDVVDDSLFEQLLQKIQQKPYGVITGIKVDHYFSGGYLDIQDGHVNAVIEKPNPGSEPSEYVNLVFHYFSQAQDFLSEIKNVTPKTDDRYEQALTALMQSHSFSYIPYQGYWQKLKYPHFVLNMMELFFEHRFFSPEIAVTQNVVIDPTATIDQSATLVGPIIIAKNAKVEAGAVIKGPAYIGENTIVGNGALVRQSMIEQDCIIGYGSEVARSYIGPECKLHHNFIGDSVLEKNVNPSYGTVTTNWRFDGQEIDLKTHTGARTPTGKTKFGAILAADVFCGAQCVILPGVTIGEGCIIYPHTTVHQDLPAHSILKSYQEQQLSDR